jgi:hypothetical protein
MWRHRPTAVAASPVPENEARYFEVLISIAELRGRRLSTPSAPVAPQKLG